MIEVPQKQEIDSYNLREKFMPSLNQTVAESIETLKQNPTSEQQALCIRKICELAGDHSPLTEAELKGITFLGTIETFLPGQVERFNKWLDQNFGETLEAQK